MLFFILIDTNVSGKQLCDEVILMCVITVKLRIINMTVMVDHSPAMMLFQDLPERQEGFFDFDGYCQFTCPVGPWAVVVVKNEDRIP